MVYYSQLVGRPVFDKDRKKIGVLNDFCFRDGVRYAVISGLLCNVNGKLRQIKWKYVSGVLDNPKNSATYCIYCITLNRAESKIKYSEPKKPALNDILDKQIIDISGARLVRVNDILLGKVGNKFAVIGVDVSHRGLMRRLGVPIPMMKIKEHVITWKDVAPLSPEIKNLQIKTKRDRLNEMHPAQIADLIRDLSVEEKAMIFNSLDDNKAARTLISAQPDIQKNVVRAISFRKIATMLESMPPHDAADILTLVPSLDKKILTLMKPGIAAKVRKLLTYSEKTAGAVMSTKFVSTPIDSTVRYVLSLIRKEMPMPRHVLYIYGTDKEGVLKGVIYLRDIAIAKSTEKISKLLRKDIFTVGPETSINDVFNLMEKYELLALPVVDSGNRIIGVIRVHDMFDLLLPEHIKRQRILRYKTLKAVENNNVN